MSVWTGDELDDAWYAEVPHSGTGTATTLHGEQDRLYQRTTVGFVVDAPPDLPIVQTIL